MKNKSDEVQLALLVSNMEQVSRNIVEIKQDIKDLKELYVTFDRFEPIERIVYGFVALVLLTVVGAILSIVVKGGF